MNDFNLVAFKQLSDIFSQILNHLLLAGHHHREIQTDATGSDAVFGKLIFSQLQKFA